MNHLNLDYESSRSVWFRDDSYRWLDEATFSITGPTEQTRAPDVLARLLVDDRYVDAYEFANNVAGELGDRPREGPSRYGQYLARLAEQGLTPHTDPMRLDYPELWRKENRPGPDHGPYVMSAFGLDTFRLMNGREAAEALNEWLTEDDSSTPSDNQIEGDLSGIIADLATAEVVFHLPDLGEEAEHTTGWILQPYLELVVVDLPGQRLRLLAGGGD